MSPTELPHRPSLRRDELDRFTTGGFAIDVVDASPSTNADLVRRARDGAPSRSVLVAEHQTAGRGRIDRTFVTPKRAALTFSVLIRTDVPPAVWPWLPLLAGLAVRAGIRRRHREVEVTLKWPNDVLVVRPDGSVGKICGILAERCETLQGPVAIVGIGINASTTGAELPVATATSLLEAGVPAESVDRTALLTAILAELAAGLDDWERGEVAGLREIYASRCDTVGRRVRVELPGQGLLEGEASDIEASGSLVVTTATGRHVVSAGDVVHVRPSGPSVP